MGVISSLHRARSASKKGTWPLPSHPSEAARCASTGIVPATSSPLFSILLERPFGDLIELIEIDRV